MLSGVPNIEIPASETASSEALPYMEAARFEFERNLISTRVASTPAMAIITRAQR